MQYFLKTSSKDGEASEKSIIVFFLGWACEYNQFARLISDELLNQKDILFVWDYSNFNFDFDLNSYKEVYLLAFSYGVFAASQTDTLCLPNLKYAAAVNGTPKPIDRSYGINPKIFNLTLKTLSKDSLDKFYSNMFDNREAEEFKKYCTEKTNNDICRLKSELENIKLFSERAGESKITFNRVFISENDKIFPAKAQEVYWTGKSEIFKLKSGHFPFYSYKIEEFIND